MADETEPLAITVMQGETDISLVFTFPVMRVGFSATEAVQVALTLMAYAGELDPKAVKDAIKDVVWTDLLNG